MIPYSSVSKLTGKRSGVVGYEPGEEYILVEFVGRKIYLYTYASCGAKHVENMKKKGDAQSHLCRYINQEDPPYECITTL
jgi:hypothetical protein